MINTKEDLRQTLLEDSKKYQSQIQFNKCFHVLKSSPISDQSKIWSYIKEMRYNEYFLNVKSKNKILEMWRKMRLVISNYRLRKLSYQTGFQIASNTIDKGLTIWHMGPIIINGRTKIGKNATIHPMVVIGYKDRNERAAIIGDNVTIAQNAVVINDFPDNVVIGGIPAKILKYKKNN